jgi:hypothetical protein
MLSAVVVKHQAFPPPTFCAGVLAAAIALLTGCTGTSPAPSSSGKKGEARLEGYGYESMRVLSERLVERLEAARQAAQDPRAGGFERREVAPRLEAVLVDARKFASRMSNYQDPPRFVREDVERLESAVRNVERGVHDVWPGAPSHDRWREAVGVLDRMKRILIGEAVGAPRGPGPVRTISPEPPPLSPEPTPRPPEPTPQPPQEPPSAGSDEAQRLANELAVRATIAYENASRFIPRSTDAERRLVSDLDYFRLRSRELESRLSTGASPTEARATVIGLREDARRLERELAARPNLRTPWVEVLRALDRLEEVTR